ncbi:hypothetical protein LP097_04230 [Moraxella bovis]|uniref:hypothetical protein n=1 Tax=Moraxella bovis TaxID=476 RepID=UPI00222807D9|nr:hypothetical protein [Moraxella bovis]UZA30846.1 hypothetical protein LP097_04230 [Moraxella bovis]
MNHTEWENIAQEFNPYDDKTLMDYHCDGMNVVYIVGMILDFLSMYPYQRITKYKSTIVYPTLLPFVQTSPTS